MQQLVIEDGFTQFARFDKPVHPQTPFQVARTGVQYAGGLGESSNHVIQLDKCHPQALYAFEYTAFGSQQAPSVKVPLR